MIGASSVAMAMGKRTSGRCMTLAGRIERYKSNHGGGTGYGHHSYEKYSGYEGYNNFYYGYGGYNYYPYGRPPSPANHGRRMEGKRQAKTNRDWHGYVNTVYGGDGEGH